MSDSFHCGVNDVVDSQSGNWSEETSDIDTVGIPQVLLTDPQLVSFVNNQISLEGHVERHYDSEVS